jgi:Tfp pilus assembly protein PilE
MELTKTSVNHSKAVDYTRNGVVISSTKTTETLTINKTKQTKTQVSNTCFKFKNVGCSGMSNLFLN